MSDSRHTDPPSEIARRCMPKDKAGEYIYPRVIEKKPRRGDVHPLDKSFLTHTLKDIVPLEYVYGLTCIELRARETECNRSS
jgi:hypothetical protein